MTLDELYNQLFNAIQDNSIVLSSALRPELGFVLQALDISPSLVVSNAILSPPTASEVILQGSAVYRGNNCDATLTGKVQGEGYAFRLDLEVSVQNPWTLGSAFNNLPDTYIAQDATLARTTSYLNSTSITQSAFSASNPPPGMEDTVPAAGFTGYLNMDGLLNQYVDFLGSGPFPLEGTLLIINQDFPILSLKADVAGKSIDLGNSSIGRIFLRLSTHAESDALPAAYSGSTLEIVGSVAVGSTSPITLDISAILLQGNIRWVFDGKFEDYTEKLAQGLEPLAGFLNTTVAGLVAPPAIKALTSFYLKDIRVSIIPPDFSKGRFLPGIDFISGTVMTKDGWFPSIPFINISNVGVRWMINTFSTGSFISSCVFGNVTFGTAPNDTTFLINACLPDFIIQCTLAKDNEFDLGQVFGWFYGGSGPSTGLKVTDLRFVADPQQKTFKFQANMTTGYSLTFGNVTFSLEEMDLWVYYRQNNVSGGIRGTMLIRSKDYTPDNPQYLIDTGLWLSAGYNEDGAWLFEGGLIPGTTLDLVTLIAQFLGVDTPPEGLPVSITIEELVTSFDTGTKTFTLSGSVVGRLKLTNVLGNLDLSLTANVDIARLPKASDSQLALTADDDNMVLVGSIFGKFAVNKFYVGAGINLKEKESTYIFTIGYDKLSLTGTTAWIGDEQNRHQIINFTLQGITLGSMIEFFVNLVRPGSDYRLDPPWDFLNSIDLSKFTLTVDPKDSWVSLTYAVDLDLFFIDIKTIGLKYIKVNGQDSVRLVLTGRFLEENYTEGNELNWDVIDDPPPAVPGQGEQLFRLRYLGLGQHIMLQNAASFNSVSDVINALRDQMKPMADTSKNPLVQPSGSLLTFNENSHWLIGLDITIMDMLSIAAVFNDPNIYGLVVSLSCPNAGSLAGFRFEILYKRITDDIGVYKAVFRMPEAFRQLQFGVVSITLGVVSVEIYTNGDFKVDLGFPKNGDFTDSFSLQVYIFIGHGGIYFGKLNGTTSSRVPVITNGTFSPVLELGIGLAVGVGREFKSGPLKAGLYVEMLAIFEGVLAWFHPNDAAQKTEMYYWTRAVAGLIGKLYGCVDFKVIKVSVSVEAYATVTLILESYQPTIVELDVGVEVKASIKILFIKINFSFGINLHESFTIGEKGTPPWITAAGGAGQPSNQLTSNVHRPSRRSHFETRALSRLDNYGKVLGHKAFLSDSLADSGYNLIWDSTPVFPDGQAHNISLKLIPAFTIDNIGVQWSESTANGAPSHKIIFMLTADNGVSADAVEHTELRKVTLSNNTAAADESEIALNLLIEAMFRWCIAAMQIGQQDDITSGQLEYLYNQLNMYQTSEQGFNFNKLSDFFDKNLIFTISSIPAGNDPNDIGGIFFPMIPTLQWTSTELGSMDYSQYNQVGPTYEKGVNDYFNKMLVNPQTASAAPFSEDNGEQTISMANYIFCDYFLMIARTVVQSALDLLSRYSFSLSSSDSLTSIASNPRFKKIQVNYAVKAGDTAASAALFFGLSADELIYLNPDIENQLKDSQPGDTITVSLGITPQSIAITNQNVELTEALSLAVGAISYQLGSVETLKSISDRFRLSEVMDLFNPLPEGMPGMSQDPLLLKIGSVMCLKQYTYANPSGLSVDLASAVFYTRLKGTSAEIAYQPWYTENIITLNQDKLKAYNGVLPEGLVLNIPDALYSTVHTQTYTTLAGDTTDWIGAYFSLMQNFNADKDPSGEFGVFNQAIRTLNPTGSGPILLPQTMNHSIEPLETLDSIWQRFFMKDLKALSDMIQEQQGLLAPLAIANIPDVKYTTLSGDTLAKVGAALNISVEKLSGSIGVYSTAGLFKSSAENPVSIEITDIPKMNMSDLVPLLQSSEIHSQVSGMLSRFFLHGLRLPAPLKDSDGIIVADGTMTGLCELTGQQVAGIAPDQSLNPEDIRAAVNFTEAIEKQWVAFYNSYTVSGDDTLDTLETKHPQLRSLNPAVHLEGRLNPGTIILTEQISKDDELGLQVKIKEQNLREGYPADTLKPVFVAPLSPMKLSETTPKSYSFQQHILLQMPVSIPLPGEDGSAAITGSPSLWVFPRDLIYRAQNTATSVPPYQLKYHQGSVREPSVAFQQYSWGTMLKISLRKVKQGQKDEVFLPDTYEVKGADQTGRYLLYQLIQALPETDNPDDKLYLMYDTSASSTIPTGLSADAVDLQNTYIIKTNLTTETASDKQYGMMAENIDTPLQGEYFAALECSRQFLLLLWECSVVGGGGFYLHYSDISGKGLPDSVFDNDGSGSIWITFLLASQSSGIAPDRKLYPFNNCAVVGINIDTSAANLFAEAADGSETVKLPAVQPGNAGFTMTIVNPEISQPPEPGQLTAQRLYSLLGYKITGQDNGFDTSPEATPTSPTEIGDPGEALSVRAARRHARLKGVMDEVPTENWQLQQVIPVSRFSAVHTLPDNLPLPLPEDDPYAGINPDAKAPLSLWFTDVFGNVSSGYSGADSNETTGGQISLTVGYMDEVIGLGKWPGVINTYNANASSDGNGAVLAVQTAFQPSTFMPGMSQSIETAKAMISKQLQRYTSIYYQMWQKDVAFGIRTSLSQAPDQKPDLLTFDGTQLRSFSSAACIWLTGMNLLAQALADTTTANNMEKLSAYYGVSYAELAASNLASQVAELFSASTIAAPAFIIFAEGDSANSLCTKLALRGIQIRPTDLLLEAENLILPIKSGTTLAIPPRQVNLPEPSMSLADIASFYRCTAGGISAANADKQGLLRVNTELYYQGLTLTVQATLSGISQSFNDIAQRFIDELGADSRTTGTDIAMANQSEEDIFNENSAFSVNDYVAGGSDTLQVNGSGAATEDLVQLNTYTINLFDAAAAVYYGEVSCPSEGSVDEFCKVYNLTPEQLFYHNRLLDLSSSHCIIIPGAATLPKVKASVTIPYSADAQDSLETITNKFDLPGNSVDEKMLCLAQANINIPGLLAPDKTVTVDQVTVQTGPDESFNSLLLKFKAQGHEISLNQLIASISKTPGYFTAGAIFICPPAMVPLGTEALSLEALSLLYGVPALTLAAANCAMLGIIPKGVTLSVTTPGSEDGQKTQITYSVTTTDMDTLNSIIARFNDQTPTSLEDIVLANQKVGLIKPGSDILLPPNTVETTVNIGTNGPKYPAAVFPVTVAVETRRSSALIHPDFDTDGPVCFDLSLIPPRIERKGNENDPAQLTSFAVQMQNAIPNLWLATSKSGSVLDSGTAARSGSEQELWAVFFAEGGISKVSVKRGVNYPSGSVNYFPRFFALRPLSTSLASQQDVQIRPLNDDGTLGEAILVDFQGIDLEVWARKFLQDIELFLSAVYSSPVWKLNGGQQRTCLDSIMSAKKTLCEAISNGIDYVLDTPVQLQEDGLDPAKESARKQLEQQLRFNLSQAYANDVILQFDSEVISQGFSKPARLCGQVKAVSLQANEEPSGSKTKFSITNAKTALDSGNAYVNFLLNVDNEQLQQSILLNLKYVFHELEFNIQKANGVEGYEASNWLSLILPIGEENMPAGFSIDLGQSVIPLPLRIYPENPQLVSQLSMPDNKTPSTIAEAELWKYIFSYQHQDAGQDTLRLTVRVNEGAAAVGMLCNADSEPTLLETLGQYTNVSEKLWNILTRLATLSGNSTDEALGNAVATLASLANNVARSWKAHWTGINKELLSNSPDTTQIYDYTVKLNPDPQGINYSTLTLGYNNANPWPGSEVPAITCITADFVEIPLTAGQPSGGTCIYTFPSGTDNPVPLNARLTFRLEFKGLNIISQQNALSLAGVSRNNDIFKQNDIVIPTNTAFVFQTPQVGFADVTTPLLSWDIPFTFGTSGSLETAIQGLLESILGPSATTRELSVSVQYGYTLVSSPDVEKKPIVMRMPVLFKPRFRYDPSVANELAAALNSWKQANNPNTKDGFWNFSVNVFSNIPGALQLPLLEFKQLTTGIRAEALT